MRIPWQVSYAGIWNVFSFTHECLALALRCEAHRKQQQEEEVLPIDSDYFTQLTINEYLPGQGISSHIGTTS